ncbi:ABC transporter permease [Pseudidiomarina aquimaris]|uniref:ABC transporter permease n=1 Tax=Pseudidiomarina aquimaris TaxID=641841 RepID=UPI003A981D53
MKRWQQVAQIGGFEFRRFFKWKQELFSLVLMAALFGISAGWGVLKSSLEETHTVAVVAPFELPNIPQIQWQPVTDLEAARTALANETYSGVLEISADAEQGYGAQLWASNRASWQERVQQVVQAVLQQRKLSGLPLTPEQVQLVNTPVAVTVTISRDDASQDVEASTAIPLLILVSIMVGVFGSFGLMMTAITQEKQQRVTEQLLTLITPSEWMDGKILGITLHCLKSMLTVVIIMMLVTVLMSVIKGGVTNLPPISPSVVTISVLFALIGLVMINAMMAGFAATIDDPNHSGRTAVMLIPALFVGAGFGIMDSPQGILAQVLSWFPLTSFAVMPVRVADGGVAWWEVAGSLAVLVFATYLIRSAAVRVFRMGITMYGKEPSWRMMGRALIGRKLS